MSRLVPAAEQIAATNPDRSNWVGANAGSGKTHVLTQRVARLLLDGAEPQHILCLTYTKAAAAEMQSRLFRTLGKWAMAPAEELGRTLGDLSGAGAPVTDAAALAAARRLFARALETPGGLKIQTIHAFCTEVLRRFPLEAGVSPRFEVADDRRSRALLAEVREAMAEAAADAFDCAARVLNEGDIDALANALLRHRVSAEDLEDRIAAHFGADGSLSEIEICKDALEQLDWRTYAALRTVLLDKGGRYDGPVGEALAIDAAERDADPEAAVDRLIRCVLTQKMEPRSTRGFPGVDVKRARPEAEDEFRRLSDWALETRDRVCAARMAARVRDLHRFAEALLARHDDAKSTRALLDFDDLVQRSRALLTDGVMRGWVLYKLDQGIDHVLVDEAQDTAPPQWDVVAAIAEEFFAGAGARPAGRSIFVVGDEKQSIYSFQGAEPNAFGRMRGHFEQRLDGIGTPLGRPDLLTSYRSAPAILGFVDAVFAGPAGEGLTVSGEPVRHVAHRVGAHGRVDLWPVIEVAEADEPKPWFEPVDAVPASDTKERLACAVATQIDGMIGTEWLGPRPPDRAARPIRPGDVLVLVSKRDRLAAGIIRELKKRGVPVAGADRMLLTGELAVQDLLALAKVACLPTDDLSLAALLRSPLCGLSEDDLFALAWQREGALWGAVQCSEHRAVAEFLADMAAQADFLRPYEFLERALVRHDGRGRLLARLGVEAEDAIDELLAQALAYETAEAPSLTGFTAWIEADEITVKREMETGDHVRVMTVHGAKGLEAPVVILPDTISGGRPGGGPMLFPAVAGGNLPALTLWAGAKAEDDRITAAARADAETRDKAERKRLLYVALTRAEDWLILCGAALRTKPKGTWYEMLAEGMDVVEATKLPSPTGAGEMRRFETGPLPQPVGVSAQAAAPAESALPAWLAAAPREPRRPGHSPSSLALAEESLHGGAGVGRALALRLGSAVHRLLERLPDHPEGRREALAGRLLTHEFADLDGEHRRAAWAEAAAVMAMAEAESVFGGESLAEVAAAIPGPGGIRMTGRIDRLVVAAEEVLIVDFKTDRVPPASAADVSHGYLAQLGAYRAAMRTAFPGRSVGAALLWTTGPALMRLDPAALDGAYGESLVALTAAAGNIDLADGRS